MLKATSKRRKTKQQIKDEKAQEYQKQNEIVRKLAEYDAMKEKVKSADEVVAEKEHYQSMLAHLYDSGIIKQAGDG